MTISYIGNHNNPRSTECDVSEAIELLGHKVIRLQENATNINEVWQNAINSDLLLITGTWDSIPLTEFINLVHELSLLGIPSATLHLDTFWGTSRGGRKWWLEGMFHTGYLFTADGDYQDQWKLLGKNHNWLPPALRYSASKPGNFRKEYECDVAFVGSNGVGYHEDVWQYRKELLHALRVICQRNCWSFKNPGGDDPKIDRGDDMNDFYASAKVTVGDSLCLKKEQSHYFSDRVFEATGRHGLLIMPQIDVLNEFFNNMLPMYSWGNYQDLEIKIKKYLEDEKLRKEIVGYCASLVKQKHTYINRVKEMLSIIFKDKENV